MPSFQLHPQLAADTHHIADWPLCSLLLMNDRRFPWLVLVPRRADLRELGDLVPGEQMQLLAEINRATRLLGRPDKLNIAMLGNMVPQLHAHVIARFTTDAAWPKPVWGAGEAQPYSEAEKAAMLAEYARLATV